MNRMFRKMALAMLMILCIASLGACKPRYKTHVQEPNQTIAPDAPQVLDFDQIHNDILELYSDNASFGFIKNLDISGSNDNPKTIIITMDCIEDVSDEAIKLFMSVLLQDISDEAVIQDSRYTSPTDESFGTVYDTYALKYTITRNDEVFDEGEIGAGEGIPFEAGIHIEF